MDRTAIHTGKPSTVVRPLTYMTRRIRQPSCVLTHVTCDEFACTRSCRPPPSTPPRDNHTSTITLLVLPLTTRMRHLPHPAPYRPESGSSYRRPSLTFPRAYALIQPRKGDSR